MPLTNTDQSADWDQQWQRQPLDLDAANREAQGPRWRAQEALVANLFGSFDGLRVVELGAGRGTYGMLYAERGAEVTLIDTSPTALKQAEHLFSRKSLQVTLRQDDVSEPCDQTLLNHFDVALSFGLCEHFTGQRRIGIIKAHVSMLRAGGLGVISVPNRYAPVYRLWMSLLKARGSWPYGTEVPFSVRELRTLAALAGATPLRQTYGSFAGSVVGQGLNPVLAKVAGRAAPVPQFRLPVLDRFAWEILLPIVRHASSDPH